jgi:hypothetical protein
MRLLIDLLTFSFYNSQFLMSHIVDHVSHILFFHETRMEFAWSKRTKFKNVTNINEPKILTQTPMPIQSCDEK